jgi:hypothetical protein
MTRTIALARCGLVCSLLAVAGCASGPPPAAPVVALEARTHALPPHVAQDVAAGYAKHRDALAAHGEWLADPRFIVRWCPSEQASRRVDGVFFVPFRTHGHWLGRASGGARWQTDEPGTWLDATTHAGWWVYRAPTDDWCWIPGAEETDGRVAWRAGGGLVGWAPLGPTDLAEGTAPPERAWTFTFLGAIYEHRTSPLLGDAIEVAWAMTMPPDGTAFYVEAPPVPVVTAARRELVLHLVSIGRMQDGVSDPMVADLPPSSIVWSALLESPMRGGEWAVAAMPAPQHLPPLKVSWADQMRAEHHVNGVPPWGAPNGVYRARGGSYGGVRATTAVAAPAAPAGHMTVHTRSSMPAGRTAASPRAR